MNIKTISGILIFAIVLSTGVLSGYGFFADDLQTESVMAVSIGNDLLYEAVEADGIVYPSISANSAILINAENGSIVYEKNARKRMSMASTTKIMTVLVALDSNKPLTDIVTITKPMTGIEGSSIYLYEGEKFTLLQLLYAVMLNSANDAATAVAIHVGGSIDGFSRMMNEKAESLGLSDTHFENPHGLDADLHYTTAYDLAAITKAAYENDLFNEIASTKSHVIKSPEGENTRFLTNHNKLLTRYKWAIGVKTGFTKKTGRCLVGAANKDGVTLITVTLNAGDDWNDHIKMFDYGFANYRNVILCTEEQFSYQLNVIDGTKRDKKDINDIKIINCKNISAESASLPKQLNEDKIVTTVELPQFIYTPVKTGQPVGKIIFSVNGKTIGATTLVACEDVELIQEKSFLENIMNFFKGIINKESE